MSVRRMWCTVGAIALAACGGSADTQPAPRTDTGEAPCTLVTWFQDMDGDCDDTTGLIAPERSEHCNGVDEDCDGKVDEEALDAEVYYADADADGFGDVFNQITACNNPGGYVSNTLDCDDDDPSSFTGAPETCDGADNDCNGVVDDPAILGASTWWADADGDGFGDAASTVESCAPPEGYVSNDADCDDTDIALSPDAEEVCGDGTDQDCNGVDESCYPPHLSEPFVGTSSIGQYCNSGALVYWTYFGELTFDECQQLANATGSQWFVGQSTSYTAGWIGDQDAADAVATNPADWVNELIVPRTSLYSCTLGMFDHRSEPTVSPVEQRYTDPEGRQWVYWELVGQTHSQAIAFADDRYARIISPNSVGRAGETWMTAPTHWCHAGAEFNGSGSCGGDSYCNFLVGYWE
jgi:hypothetical protein